MKTCNFVISLGFIALSAAFAQGPMYDKVTVSLPYPVTVNGTILQPGDYVIRQHEDQSGSRVLHFFTNEGMKLETTAMAIPTMVISCWPTTASASRWNSSIPPRLASAMIPACSRWFLLLDYTLVPITQTQAASDNRGRFLLLNHGCLWDVRFLT